MADQDTSPDVDLASQITEAPTPEQLKAMRERVEKTREARINAEREAAVQAEGADRLAEAKRLASELVFEEQAKAIAEAHAAGEPTPSTEEIFNVPVVEAPTEPPSNGTQTVETKTDSSDDDNSGQTPPTPPSTGTDQSDNDPANIDLTGEGN